MKVALVYDRVNKWGGAERVLLALHELFPQAPLYTSLYSPVGAPWAKVFPSVNPSFLQKLPGIKTRHELVPYLMPLAFESFDFNEFDLVVSVTSESGKGILTGPHTKHICYCLTPTRYLWSSYDDYFHSEIKKTLVKPLITYLRRWDRVAAARPDKIVAISTEVQERIKRYYDRDSTIIYPPVELAKFKYKKVKRKNFFLLVSRLVPYKKVDLAVQAFNRLKLPLVIVGTGSEENRLKKLANANIFFMGSVPDLELSELYLSCRALIFPQNEDFGLVAVEAQACGAPVIAYAKGGAKDTVIEGNTGLFFQKQTVDDLVKTIKNFSQLTFDSKIIATHAKKFSKERFKEEFLKIINL